MVPVPSVGERRATTAMAAITVVKGSSINDVHKMPV